MVNSELTTCSYCQEYKLEREMWSRRICFTCKPIADNKIFEYETKKAKLCGCQKEPITLL